MGRYKTSKVFTFRLELSDYNKLCMITNNPAALLRALIKRYLKEKGL